MNYQPFTADAGHLSGENILRDDTLTVPYSGIGELLEQLDRFFSDHDKKKICCVALITENTVAHALIILYLLREKLNFILLNGHAPVEDKIPFFCDIILTVAPSVSGRHDWPGNLQLVHNPGHKRNRFAITRHSGSIFFLSSGTSGQAKYIYFKQQNLLRNANNCVKRFAIDDRSRVLVPVPVNHMYGMGVGLLPALLSGASICLIDKNNIVKLLDRISTFQPSVTLFTPAVIKMLLLLRNSVQKKGVYITAGEKLADQAYKDFEYRYGPLFNLYGCTELGAIAVSDADGNLKALEQVKVRISPAENGQIVCRHNAGFVSYLDRHGHRVPSQKEGQGWYRTNDIGMVTGDQGFRVIGRADHCTNRYGFLVSLDEVASLLESLFAEINQAIVLEGKKEKGLSTNLVAVCE